MKNKNSYLLPIASFFILNIFPLQCNASSVSQLEKSFTAGASVAAKTVPLWYNRNNGTPIYTTNLITQSNAGPSSQNLAAPFRADKMFDLARTNQQSTLVEQTGLTDKINSMLKDLIKDDNVSIEGLQWTDLKSEQQKILYIKHALKDYTFSKDFNFAPLVQFLEMILENATKSNEQRALEKNSGIKFALEFLNWYFWIFYGKNKIITENVVSTITMALQLSYIPWLTDVLEWWHPNLKEFGWKTAYHESAHALIGALYSNSQVVMHVTRNLPHPHEASISRFSYNQNIDFEQGIALEQFKADAQYIVMSLFAGGLGMAVYEEENPDFRDFVSISEYGQGTVFNAGSDMAKAVKIAKKYCTIEYFDRVSRYQEEPDTDKDVSDRIIEFLEECFEKSRVALEKNRSKLDSMAQQLHKKRTLNMDEVYEIAQVKRPKFQSEFTPLEKIQYDLFNWLIWTGKRVQFYEQQHFQV